jgi:phosphopantetheine--protein transferase-like protein
VDLEDIDRERPGVARRVLTDAEFAEMEALPEGRRWTDAVIRFAAKECIYKALQPRLRRYIGFGEAEVFPDPSGVDRVRLLMAEAGAWAVDARHTWLGERVLASVRASARARS